MTSMAETIVVLMTAPDAEQAATIARALCAEKLAACVNIVPQVRSIYTWQEKINDESEALCVIKTTRVRLEALCARIVALHPYDVPEVIALPIEAGHAPYLEWVRASTRD